MNIEQRKATTAELYEDDGDRLTREDGKRQTKQRDLKLENERRQKRAERGA